MKPEKELLKLIDVLRRTGRLAKGSEWTKDPIEAACCLETYNRVLKRLKESDPEVAAIFDPLPPDVSLTVVAMACRQLAAYYEDELDHKTYKHFTARRVNERHFYRDFWRKSALDIENLGDFIRASIAEWACQRESVSDATANVSETAGQSSKPDEQQTSG